MMPFSASVLALVSSVKLSLASHARRVGSYLPLLNGGGGTVAVYMAERNIDTLDAGVPVLSMHAPFETVGKLDCYMTFKGMKAVFEAK